MTPFENTDRALAQLLDDVRPYLVAMLKDDCEKNHIEVAPETKP